MAGEGRFVVVESVLLYSQKEGWDCYGIQRIYKNFILRLEWKVSDEGDNSGVFVRFPHPNDNPNIAVREGYEI